MHRIIPVEYSVPSPVLTPSVQLGLGSTECRAGACDRLSSGYSGAVRAVDGSASGRDIPGIPRLCIFRISKKMALALIRYVEFQFHNANKRTAFTTLVIFLRYSGLSFKMDTEKAEDFKVIWLIIDLIVNKRPRSLKIIAS